MFVYKFITQNSIEEKILNLQNSKLKMSDSLINDSQITINAKELIELL